MASLVHEILPEAHFIWIGDGPLEKTLRQTSRDLGIYGVMHFAGQRDDVPALLKELDCFALPSLWEGFPIVILEAMAAGVPVVATDIPGNDESIHSGKNGWLVPPNNPQALAERVVDLLTNTHQADAFRANSYERLKNEFTKQGMLSAVENLYKEVATSARIQV
jgi:glycosyltransferase involved in cell wall biosynthesis